MSGRANPDQPRYVVGHGLQGEGAPFDGAGRRVYATNTSGKGRGKCACGALSAVLPSAGARRRWHVAHKATVLSAPGKPTLLTVRDVLRAHQWVPATSSCACGWRVKGTDQLGNEQLADHQTDAIIDAHLAEADTNFIREQHL
jgi:hypothetical protein